MHIFKTILFSFRCRQWRAYRC